MTAVFSTVDSDEIYTVEAGGTTYELVCGLEVHAELATATKMFSSAPNRFGDAPNTNIDPVTLGLPGTLPVVNEKAIELAIRFGLATGGEIRRSVFSRKNYFYPDMPKDFQISQYDLPIVSEGTVDLPGGHVVGLERAHLEEDTGKSTHVGGDGRITGADHSLVDYNRAGVPLLEIVSRPHVRTPEQARQYVSELRSILVAAGVSDGKMEEGSLRVDANVSVRPVGSDALGTRCEIKNLNSLRSLGRAIEYEAKRQAQLLADGETVAQQTRHWNEETGRTSMMRSKEEADDYRYFPEPDLLPVDPDPAWIEQIGRDLPPMPAARRTALAEATGVTLPDETVALIVERDQDAQAHGAIAAGADPARVLVHVSQNLSVEGGADLAPERLAALIALETSGALTATQAKAVLAEMLTSDATPEEIAAAKGYEAMDTGALEAMVDEVIAGHADEWEQFRTGDAKAQGKLTGFFVGQVMRASKGQADGKAVTALLRTKAGL
ncbi:Asp-tRNA(Asn)/Glu-tRNA(Gln) amidotransferase subunit GatB [Iamia sp. SCSIO 61187]|uniref:Asp-tRNA(Asn)/Glu-tRNA(Gln) amidotransferase subunit GatB n=1 Tax=Iamia sp. SCSIO 61187 TaxID=2722752 RepID=UPI001C634E5B|nr:Asp-tRNA(Asn)/Glu-tRNA(Gln) amidotransferase subunit GatB [Iamia sp. SCSIO 61187]QYG94552.1 Asp-tRNA(Asn)/Glu-tRNA(Gln) amidotransferase subunit GatB [Iamia sp. SCSIO 61187]